MEYYDLPEDKVFLISQKALIRDSEGKLLLLRVGGNDLDESARLKWDLPGGLLKINEDMADGLIREVREEINMDIEIEGFFSASDHNLDSFVFKNGSYKKTRIVVLGYLCSLKENTLMLGEEHTEYKWFTKEELKSANFTNNSAFMIKKYLEKF